MFRKIYLLPLLLLGSLVLAEDRYLLLGGGAGPDSSEASIENNVIWIKQLLRERGIENLEVVFATGTEASADVKQEYADANTNQAWLPLARVFGEQQSLQQYYRANTVAENPMQSNLANVTDWLQQEIAATSAGDDLLLIYNGHGGYKPGDTRQNNLRLWGETHLTVSKMSELLTELDTGATFRYVLPQCFSGAFAGLMYADLQQPSLRDVPGNRCGFMPVPDTRESEGCRPDLNLEDYRDYSNFFFAAIDGKMRTGAPLSHDPDLNKDGAVSLREAHFFTMLEAYSIGVPRATSEEFLMRWQPWSLRWQSSPIISSDNEYTDLASRLASKLGFTNNTVSAAMLAEMASRRDQVELALQKAQAELAQLNRQEKKLRKQLRKQTLLRWPQLAHTYDPEYIQFITLQLSQVTQWIEAQEQYPQLAALQQQWQQLDRQLRERERDQGMLRRLQRVLVLAGLQQEFLQRADADLQQRYQQLLQCESWQLPDQATR